MGATTTGGQGSASGGHALPVQHQALLVRGDALRELDLRLDVCDRVASLHVDVKPPVGTNDDAQPQPSRRPRASPSPSPTPSAQLAGLAAQMEAWLSLQFQQKTQAMEQHFRAMLDQSCATSQSKDDALSKASRVHDQLRAELRESADNASSERAVAEKLRVEAATAHHNLDELRALHAKQLAEQERASRDAALQSKAIAEAEARRLRDQS